jgi:exoribonuclease-2
MELGNIVEFIDRERILCAVVVEIRNQRLRLLTENNREVNLGAGRLLHRDRSRMDLSLSRLRIVDALKAVSGKRKALTGQVGIRELWEVLSPEQQWVDLETMTAFCFPDAPNGDHQSAVLRALFDDRLYFKFNPDRFFPNTEEQVERIIAHREEESRRRRIIEKGGDWLRRFLSRPPGALPEPQDEDVAELLEVLKSSYLFEKQSPDDSIARGVLERAGLDGGEDLFPILCRVGVFREHENIELLRLRAPVEFSVESQQAATELVGGSPPVAADARRVDLTGLNLFTIDGQSTLDYDDALSLEVSPAGFRLGIHIADVAHYVRKGGPVDLEARRRGSSIYMADQKIPMLPAVLAEGLCSLRAGELRPAISTLVDLSPELDITGCRVIASTVRVRRQLTYFDVNLSADQDPNVMRLRDIARRFREFRLAAGAVHISVPEINIWLSEGGEINLNRVNRESPGRMLVAEIMIMANWLMARLLAEHGVPAIFRSQPAPRDRLYRGEEGTLFQHWMQRRLLSRFALGHAPEAHSGLGLGAYVTATSPIRKYFDLVTQRQVRSILGLEAPYTPEEIDAILAALETPMGTVGRLQAGRQRYWLLRYLEQRVGQKAEAIVLQRRRSSYQILLTEYMLECDLPISGHLDLKPEDLVQVTLQKVDARKDAVVPAIG